MARAKAVQDSGSRAPLPLELPPLPEQQPRGVPGPRQLSGLSRTAISLAILAHFFAIFTAVTAAGNRVFPAPPLAVTMNEWVRPYLQLVFLTNPYRFYAPEPGPTNLMWFRVQYKDGTVRWFEFPRREDFVLRMPFQRGIALTMLLDSQMEPDMMRPNQYIVSPTGKICVASYIRHVARTVAPGDGRPADPQLVEEIQAYNVDHLILEPRQVQQGWGAYDLRLYRFVYLGSYNAEGQSRRNRVVEDIYVGLDTTFVAERVVTDLIRQRERLDPGRVIEQPGFPLPVRELARRHRDLLTMKELPTHLGKYIEQLVEEGTAKDVPDSGLPQTPLLPRDPADIQRLQRDLPRTPAR
ncbi:MAG: hypothetical protein C4297_05335 [Gemmataceae bacterium]